MRTTDHALAAHRLRIDEIDTEMIRLLGERFRITLEIGFYKADNDLPPVDLVRQHQQLDRLRELARAEGLDQDFVERFVHMIMDEVILNHTRIARAGAPRSAGGTE